MIYEYDLYEKLYMIIFNNDLHNVGWYAGYKFGQIYLFEMVPIYPLGNVGILKLKAQYVCVIFSFSQYF